MSYQADKPKRGWGRSCLVGCLWTLAVLLVVVGVGIYWAMMHGREWFANQGAEAIKQGIQAADLPEEEKDELGVEIDRVATAFGKGQLTLEQVGGIMEMIAESPLAGTIAVAVADSKYFSVSGLSDEEKEEGRHTLRRFARGVIDGKIPEAKRDEVLSHIGQQSDDGNWQMRERLSDEELREFLAAAKAEADAAMIEDQPPDVDLSEELKKIVDQALAGPDAP
jgi:hypothetical protein